MAKPDVMPPVLKHALLERLTHYYHALLSVRREPDSEWVSSLAVAEQLNLDDSQVRRDLSKIGLRGHSRLGFNYNEVVAVLRRVMGLDREWRGVIVGVGRLGSALAAYGGFADYGLMIVGLFDVDLSLTGRPVAGLRIQPLPLLERMLRSSAVDIGIVAVPAEGAQRVADILVAGRVRSIWNFAPVNLDVPPECFVRNEHISVGLGELAHFLKTRGGPASRR